MLWDLVFITVTSVLALFITLAVCMSNTVNGPTKISFASITTSLALWNISIFIADNVTSHLVLLNNLVFLWPTVASVSSLAFVSLLGPSVTVVKKKTIDHAKDSKLMPLIILALGLQMIAIISNRIFDSVTYDPMNNTYTLVRGPLYPAYIVGIVLLMGLIIIRLMGNYLTSKKQSQERQALKIVLITIAVVTCYSILTNIVIPLATNSQQYIYLGTLSLDIFALGLAFSVIRYRFLEIRSYVFRTVVYLVTLLLAALIYTIITSVVSVYLLHISLKPEAILLLAVITLGVASSFHPLRNYFNKQTKRLFFRDYYDPQDVLDEIGNLLVGTVDVRIIKDTSKTIISKILHPTSIQYLLIREQHDALDKALLSQLLEAEFNVVAIEELDPKSHSALINYMHKRDIALAVRLHTTQEDLGFMLFGFRQSGTGYSFGDRRLLGQVADQLALGLQNALRFEEIERFNVTLQEKIEDATHKLRGANKRLLQLDSTKDDFISMASHQLRTPLTSIKGYLSLVLDGDSGSIKSSQRKLLTQAFTSSQRMAYLIADLLNVSRLRTGKFTVEVSDVNLADIVEDETKQLVETAAERSLNLNYDKPAHFPVLQLDETKTRQVIMNFIDNAMYYTPSGGHIDVILSETPKTIELRVTDNGIGVPKAEQYHLFSKFYRAKNAQKARPDGTGLGLFMAKKVIVAQGGAVIFSSREGHGSTFGFSFAKDRRIPKQDH